MKTIKVDFNTLGNVEDGIIWTMQKYASNPVLVGDMVYATHRLGEEFSCFATVVAVTSRGLVKLAVDPAVWAPAVA